MSKHRPIPQTGDPKIDQALNALYQQVCLLEEKIGESGLDAKQNYEGIEGLVRIINTTGGGYALTARSKDGWLTSNDVTFQYRDKTELTKPAAENPIGSVPAHGSSHIAGGSDALAVTSLSMGSGTAGVWLEGDGTWSDPGAGGGITSLNGLTGSTQTFADVDDTNVTLGISSATTTHTFTVGWTGQLAVARGGLGTTAITGLVTGSGSAYSGITDTVVGRVLRTTGSNTFAFGALDLADTDAVTGTLPVGNFASHDIISKHTASGLTSGHFLKATGTTTFGFTAHGLTYTDVGAASSSHTHSEYAGIAESESITGAWLITTGSLGVYDQKLRFYDGNINYYYAIDTPADWVAGTNGTLVLPNVASGSTFITTGNLTSITTVGTITAGAWQSSTAVGTAYGGTNLTAFTANGFMYASSTSVLATSSNLSTDGSKITKYNSVATDGLGVAPILDYYDTGSIDTSETGVTAANSTASGWYRVALYVRVHTVSGANSSIICDINWRNDRASSTLTESTASLAATAGAGQYKRLDLTIYHGGGGSYSITMDANITNEQDDSFQVIWSVERLN